MIEDSLRRLLSSDVIYNNMDKIINAFVTFYGEDKRKYIENRFKNTLILKIMSNQSLCFVINKIKQDIIKEIYNIKENKQLYFNLDNVIRILEDGDVESLERELSSEEKRLLFDGESSSIVIIKCYKNKMFPKFNKLVSKYKEIMNKIKLYIALYEKQLEESKKIGEKYLNILKEEFKRFISAEDLDEYYLSGGGNCFDDEHEQMLNDPKTPISIKSSILIERIEILKKQPLEINSSNIGILNYEEYLKDKESNMCIARLRTIYNRLSKRSKELYEKSIFEILNGLDNYKECKKKIEEQNFVDSSYLLKPLVYFSIISSFTEAFVKKDNSYELRPIVLLNSGDSNLDLTLIHELNHAFECFVQNVDEDGFSSCVGWDQSIHKSSETDESDVVEYEGITREYELINEYINDRIAQDISFILHKEDNGIFNFEYSKSNSVYMNIDFLLSDFYNEFKDIIIESRFNGNIGYLYKMIGRENFELLNKLVNEYYKEFGFKPLIEGEYTLSSLDKSSSKYGMQRKCLNFVSKKDGIISNMKEYRSKVLKQLKG